MSDEYIRKADAIDLINKISNLDLKAKGGICASLANLQKADVIPVVRCKDCGWAMKSTELPGWYMCKCEEAFDYYAKPDDFCSHGKRKE